MDAIAVLLKIDEEHIAEALQEVCEKLDSAQGEIVLDFSSVHRVAPPALRAMEDLAGRADGKGVKIALRGVNIDIYKVLKLAKLASRFSLLT